MHKLSPSYLQKPALMVQSQESAETTKDPIFQSRELVFQRKISQAKHRRNVFMAGTENFGATTQPRDHIPDEFCLSSVNTRRKSHNHTLSRH